MTDKETFPEGSLGKSVEIGTLCAFYGSLLTQRQLDAVRLHYAEDYSLGEIAEMQGSTRQNVHETITRSEQKLREWEEKLGLVRKSLLVTQQLETIRSLTKSGNTDQAISLLDDMILNQEGEERKHGL